MEGDDVPPPDYEDVVREGEGGGAVEKRKDDGLRKERDGGVV